MSDVYCGGCKHFMTGYSDRNWECCMVAEKVSVTTKNYRGKSTVLVPLSPEEKNKHNDCKDWEKR